MLSDVTPLGATPVPRGGTEVPTQVSLSKDNFVKEEETPGFPSD